MADGRGNKRSNSCGPDEVFIPVRKAKEQRENPRGQWLCSQGTPTLSTTCATMVKRNKLTQANLGRRRCDRTMVRNFGGPELTGNDIVTLLGH